MDTVTKSRKSFRCKPEESWIISNIVATGKESVYYAEKIIHQY